MPLCPQALDVPGRTCMSGPQCQQGEYRRRLPLQHPARKQPFANYPVQPATPGGLDAWRPKPWGMPEQMWSSAVCCELGLVGAEAVAGIARVAGAKRVGTRVGNWLSAEQSRRLLDLPSQQSSRGLRDRAMLAMMLGYGFRRRELASLDAAHLRSREGR